MQGHLFKYKDKDGKWIEIPILVESMYNAYVAYCTEKNIDPVPEYTYYKSVGELQNLVNKLDGSADQVAALISALGDGVLPQRLGGLGVSIGTEQYPDLQTALELIANVVTNPQLNDVRSILQSSIDTLNTAVTDLTNNKANKASFTSGDKDPTTTTPGEYYFQYK